MTSPISIRVEQDLIRAKFPYQLREAAKAAGGRWDAAAKEWTYPVSPTTAKTLWETCKTRPEVDGRFTELLHQSKTIAEKSHALAKVGAHIQPRSKTVAWDHQLEAFHFAKDLPAAGLFMEMGCGKSKTTVDICTERGHRLVLILCPFSVIGVWSREFATHAIDAWDVIALDGGHIKDRVLHAEKKIALANARGNPCAIVINHEAAWREPFASFALAQDWDAVIVDESHRSKQPDGKFARWLASFSSKRAQRLCLTGTPMPHSPLDIWAQYRFLDPGIFGTSFFLFKNRYAVTAKRTAKGRSFHEVVGYQNQDDLHERIYRIAYRITKDRALQLPDELHVVRSARFGRDALQLYRQLAKTFYAEIESGEVTIRNALVKLLRLQQITSGHITDDEGNISDVGTHKRDLLSDVLSDIHAPCVVFCRFVHDLDRVRSVAGSLGRRYGEISGAQKDLTPDAKMPENIDVMGVQIQAGGVGIDLTRASTAIYYSVGFNLGDYLQSMSRVHRPGQQNKVTYIHLVVEDTIDEVVYEALEKRMDVIEAVLRRKAA